MDNFVKLVSRRALTQIFFLSLFVLGVSLGVAQTQNKNNLSVLRIDESIAVRFYFQPPNSDFPRPPLIFRVAHEDDPNWNTGPISEQGRFVYISMDEMREFLSLLRNRNTNIMWSISKERQEMQSYMKLQQPIINMMITVFAANGTASGSVPSKRLCTTLSKFDTAIKTPRAKWEFTLFRRMYRCKVPQIDDYAYPDHYGVTDGRGGLGGHR